MCKSAGSDGVHPRLLKQLSNHLCIPLARLFDNSLDVGELPKEWKHGRISAIFKKGGTQQFGCIKACSTVLHLLNVMDSLCTRALDRG